MIQVSGIQTGIELNDQFSSIVYGIISAVNMAVSSMEDMQQTMNSDVDTSGIQGIRDELNQATIAMNELNAAMQNQELINTNPVVQPQTPDPMERPITPAQPRGPPLNPVEIPVTWNTDGLEVFTGTGIDRFQQEVQSANNMLHTLNQTQAQIEQTASGIDILPDAAVQDINAMGHRLQTIQQRIQQIENNPVNLGTDTANAELEQLRAQLNRMIQEQNELNDAMAHMDVSAANDAYLRLSQLVSGTERYIRDNVDEQGRFNREIQEGTQQASELTNTIKNAVLAYISIQSLENVLNISDELMMTTSRLNMMNDGLQTTEELVNMVYAAAQDARGSFSEMTDVVARFGNNAKDAFGSSEEVVAFADLIQKQMTIAGASTQEASNAMLQLSQALGSGVLRGDELNSIFEQAPNLIQSIADYLDVPIGQIREMASQGELTADIVKNAIFASADDINAKFKAMPVTWGQIWQSMKNTALVAFRPVLQRLNDLANSEAFQNFVDSAIKAMATLADIVLNIFDLIGTVGSFIADNWSAISPIVYDVATALGVYAVCLGVVKGLELACAAASAAMVIGKGLLAAATMIATGVTWGQAAAQVGLNGAMYACPIVWIIGLIVALIAAIILLWDNCEAFRSRMVTMGADTVKGLGQFYNNVAVPVVNGIISMLNNLMDSTAGFLAGIVNGFADMAVSVVESIDWIIDKIQGMMDLFNEVSGFFGGPTVDVNTVVSTDSIEDVRSQALQTIDSLFEGSKLNPFEEMDLNKLNQFVDDAAARAEDFRVSDFVQSLLDDLFSGTDIPSQGDYLAQLEDVINNSGVKDNLDSIAGSTGSIADAMDITQEELKYMRDIAEQEAVNRYTVAEIHIDQSGMQNTINSGDDIDGFMTKLTDSVNEAVDNMTEGVHE